MTSKHFIALADALRESKPNLQAYDDGIDYLSDKDQWDADVKAIANVLEADNPAFNRERWLAYINGEVGPKGGTLANGKKV